jgi:hypothetical protein
VNTACAASAALLAATAQSGGDELAIVTGQAAWVAAAPDATPR